MRSPERKVKLTLKALYDRYWREGAVHKTKRVLAPDRIDAPRLQRSAADVGLYLTVDIDTIAWYKAGIRGGVK
jgi:hypothetical protein